MVPTLSFVPKTGSNSKDLCQPCLLTPARRTTWLVLAPFLLHPAYLEIRFKFPFCGSKGEENWVPHHNRGPFSRLQVSSLKPLPPRAAVLKLVNARAVSVSQDPFCPHPWTLSDIWRHFCSSQQSRQKGCYWHFSKQKSRVLLKTLQCIGQIAQQIIRWSTDQCWDWKYPP